MDRKRRAAPDKSARQSLEADLLRERDRLQMLLEVGNVLVSHRDLHELLQAISACVRRVLQHDYLSLSLYDPDLRQFRVYAIDFPRSTGVIHEQVVIAVEGSPHGQAMRTGKPLLVNRLEARRFPSDITTWLLAEGICSACWLPLLRGDRCLGVLNVASLRQSAFGRQELSVLAQVANQVAVAVENTLAFDQITELKDRLAEERDYLEDEIRSEHHYDEIVGESPAWKAVLQQVETVAPTDATVLLQGETGTGKELIARAIHSRSRRSGQTFVKMSCAAVPTGLLESELFGHEKGAFTGAIARQIGRFELAHRGTLFLDEVGDIAPELQPKILRALQEQEFERLGSGQTRKVDVRVLAATNRNLAEMVSQGEFRNDLYYRLNVFPIVLPALRARPTDIPLLVRYFVQKHAQRMRRNIDTIPPPLMQALSRWHWPGNVRELENFIERAVILSRRNVLEAPLSELEDPRETAGDGATLEAIERQHILRVLRECQGRVSGPRGAAARLGMNRSTLNSRMRKLGISRADIW
jgi:formate hydrogenlyase transcriptional activator